MQPSMFHALQIEAGPIKDQVTTAPTLPLAKEIDTNVTEIGNASFCNSATMTLSISKNSLF